jgi:TolA-binding protein
LLLLLVVVCLGVAPVIAVPLAEYHQTLDHIIADLDSLSTKEENETDAVFESRFSETIEAMRGELPKTQPVELEKETWNTDNSAFHTALDELQRAKPEERARRISQMIESLRALDERVNDLETAEQVTYDKNAANERLKGILARPEYSNSSSGQNALSRLLLDFIRWLQNLFPKPAQVEPGRGSVITQIVQFAVVVVALLLIAYVVRLLLIRFKRPGAKKIRKKREPRIVLGERLEPEQTATDLLSEAEALARRGDLRSAIRKGYIALLIELGDRKLISLAQYKTNRDYLRSVSTHPQLHSRVKNLTDSFERHWYGYAQVTPTDWQDFRTGYREALQHGN